MGKGGTGGWGGRGGKSWSWLCDVGGEWDEWIKSETKYKYKCV